MEHVQGFIERGRIAQATETGYVVESLDRKGIVSPPLSPIQNETYGENDLVLFVLFRDGTGKILCMA